MRFHEVSITSLLVVCHIERRPWFEIDPEWVGRDVEEQEGLSHYKTKESDLEKINDRD